MSRRSKRVIAVGLLIQDARRRAGITQIVASKVAGVSRVTWSEWERGHHIPSSLRGVLDLLKRIERLSAGRETRKKFRRNPNFLARMAWFYRLEQHLKTAEGIREYLDAEDRESRIVASIQSSVAQI